MSGKQTLQRYGVLKQTTLHSDIDRAAESLRVLGYAVIDGGYQPGWLSSLSEAFDRTWSRSMAEHGGRKTLEAIDEHNTIRLPLAYETIFVELATNKTVLELCSRLITDYIILNQQNGVINPPHASCYNQGCWHRDLPYQHFVSSRPLALNALFCIDAFTKENGATQIVPASHYQEAFPSDQFLAEQASTIEARAGSFIVLDGMVYHSGGINHTELPRRAVSHLYSIPLLRQQIDLPAALGEQFTSDPDLRRLLGYESRSALTVAAFLKNRKRLKHAK